MKTKTDGILIARVSTLKQEKEGLSLKEIQLPKLQQYALVNNLNIVKEFVFSESADRKIRTKFNEVIAYVKENSNIKAIISYRVDRVTRNYRDAVLFDDLRLEYGKELHFIDDGLVLDKTSNSKDMQDWDLKVFLAKQYINRLKEDAYNTIQRKLDKGELPGQAPFGLKNILKPNGDKWVEPDPYKAKIVEKIYILYASGSHSISTIQTKLLNDYGLRLDRNMISNILKNPIYYGEIRYHNRIVTHHYEPIISKELFNKAQEVRLNYHKKKYKYAGKPAVYRGLITCQECGCLISPQEQKGRFYYHCTGSKVKHKAEWIREDSITQQFATIFSKMHIPESELTDIVSSLKESHQAKNSFYKDLLNQLQTEYSQLEGRIERIYEDLLDGRITTAIHDKKSLEYRQKQMKIEDRLSSLRTTDESYYMTASYILNLASRAEELFISANMEEKRDLINLAFQNFSLNGKNVEVAIKKPFDTIIEYASCTTWLPSLDSNQD